MQYIVGADRPFWNGLDEKDVVSAITAIKDANVSLLSVSPHDSSDWALEQVKNTFKEKFVDLKVGKDIRI